MYTASSMWHVQHMLICVGQVSEKEGEKRKEEEKKATAQYLGCRLGHFRGFGTWLDDGVSRSIQQTVVVHAIEREKDVG